MSSVRKVLESQFVGDACACYAVLTDTFAQTALSERASIEGDAPKVDRKCKEHDRLSNELRLLHEQIEDEELCHSLPTHSDSLKFRRVAQRQSMILMTAASTPLLNRRRKRRGAVHPIRWTIRKYLW